MMPTTTASRIRLDSRARTSARNRRGISKGLPTLATSAITAHHAVVAIVGSGRGSASLSSQNVVFLTINAAGAPPRLRQRRVQWSSYSTSVWIATNPAPRPGRERRSTRVNEYQQPSFRKGERQVRNGRAGRRPYSSDQTPAEITEDDKTDDNQRGGDDATQR